MSLSVACDFNSTALQDALESEEADKKSWTGLKLDNISGLGGLYLLHMVCI